MNNASLELGGDNWAAKDTKLLASTVSDDSGRFYPREFTFSRGSNLSATRVNADGLIEKGYENLLLQSNQFDTTWTTTNTSVTSGQSGYDGSSDAWELEVTANGTNNRITQIFSQTGIVTFSVYAKASSTNFIYFYHNGTGARVYFNLQNGTFGNTFLNIDSKIEAVSGASGWYRCSMTINATSSSQIWIIPSNALGSASTDLGNSIYIQNAQAEIGLAALPYIESGSSTAKAGILENEPRIDYSSGTPSLLLEPQRTNSATHSEYFGSWSAFRATITDNAATSPEGVSNAAVLTEDTTNNSHPLNKTFSVSSGVEHTLTIFAKQGSRRYLALLALNGGSNIYYDLQEKTAGSGGSVEDYGNGWLRLIYTYTTNSTSAELYIQPSIDGSSAVYTGDGSNAVFLYGAQLESGSYPTSYIPTYGTSQTRGADRPQILNTTTDVLSQTAFTLFFEADLTSDTTNNFKDIVAFRGPSKELRFETRIDNSVRVQSNMITSGDTFNSATIGDTDNKKFAMTFTTSQVRLYADGSLVSTYNGVYSSDLVHILFMNSTSLGVETKTNFKQYLLFTSALSDNECIELTTI